jgi:anti-sigma factor RsiW
MKWLWNPCRRQQDLSLLAAGALDAAEKLELENHLAACEECRSYYHGIRKLTAPLAAWDKDLSPIEATTDMQNRWARAIQAADTPTVADQPSLKEVCQFIWRELIRPSRYAWGGMAAAWLVMLAIDGSLADHKATETQTQASSPQAIMQAWEEQNRIMAELTQPDLAVPAPPQILPRPRSERKRTWNII